MLTAENQTLFGFDSVAKRFSISGDTLRRLARIGELKTVTIAGRRLIHIDEILRIEREGLGAPRKRWTRQAPPVAAAGAKRPSARGR
jgi:hypothetical protein